MRADRHDVTKFWLSYVPLLPWTGLSVYQSPVRSTRVRPVPVPVPLGSTYPAGLSVHLSPVRSTSVRPVPVPVHLRRILPHCRRTCPRCACLPPGLGGDISRLRSARTAEANALLQHHFLWHSRLTKGVCRSTCPRFGCPQGGAFRFRFTLDLKCIMVIARGTCRSGYFR